MKDMSNKDSDRCTSQPISHGDVNCQVWWNSNGSQIPPSSLHHSPRQDCHNVKQLSFQVQDQDSSSTHSSGQSHHEVSNIGGSNGHQVSVQSEDIESFGKQADAHVTSVLSLGTQEFILPHSQVDYTQSMARLPYPYIDPYTGGLLASYGPQAIIHPQMMGVAPTRVPLPLELAENEPIFVNAKQYRGIIRRRQSRAKLEAHNKLIKDRKPYLHESRHLHALKRARGTGGRFLNTKKLEQSKQNSSINGQSSSESASLQLCGNVSSESERIGGTSTISCSEISTASNGDDIFRQSDFRFSGYSHLGGNIQDGGSGIMCNGSNHRVPVGQ